MELLVLIVIVLFFASLSKIFSPEYIGYLGEKKISSILSRLPKEDYKVIDNLLIKSATRTLQIDHVVVSRYGIFVIETKNYTGWITGTDYSEYWTKNMYGNKYKFYNPIKQNKGHIFALSKQLGIKIDKFISVVVFLNNADLKINTSQNVIYAHQVNDLIRAYTEVKFSGTVTQAIFDAINSINIITSEERDTHISDIKKSVEHKENLIQQGICPKCGHSLSLKEGKYGYFIGCDNYPNCRFTQPYDEPKNIFF